MMWSPLKTLALGLTLAFTLFAEHAASQVVARVQKGSSEVEGTTSDERALFVMGGGKLTASAAHLNGHMVERELLDGDTILKICKLIIDIILAWRSRSRTRQLQDGSSAELNTFALDVTISDPVNGATVYSVIASAPYGGMATATVDLTEESQMNGEDTGICDECTLSFVAGECLSGPDCEYYDMDTTNANMGVESAVCGDPHMIGLLGQKIDWYGEDKGWYCLLADSEFQVNTRVTAPMPQEFPTRQLVSGVSLMTANGHSLVIEVKNPYTSATEGCSAASSSSCLAEAALRILVDGVESEALQTPGERIALPGGVVVSSANLPVECRPFGGDRIWAAQYAEMNPETNRRSLRAAPTPFVDWLMKADTIAAPDWCAKFVSENGAAGMSKVQSNHAIIRIETPAVTLRVNIGINYQDAVLGADGNVLVPELDFWQTDLAFEGLLLSGEVEGMLGDTSSFTLDNSGMPITSGMAALHGTVESYRVTDSLGVNFEQQLH